MQSHIKKEEFLMSRERIKIRDLATISSGYTFRHKIDNQSDGDLGVVQPKDAEPDFINESSVFKIRDEGMKDRFILKKGDVLFLGKGANNYSVCFKSEQRSVAASSFFVIRLNTSSNALPEYLAYYLNYTVGQKLLSASKEGTYVSNVSKKSLEDIEVILPDIQEQKKLCKLFELGKKEIQLTQDLLVKKQMLYKTIQNNAIKGHYNN